MMHYWSEESFEEGTVVNQLYKKLNILIFDMEDLDLKLDSATWD